MPTLYEIYTAKGKPLPPPSQRFSDPEFAAAAASAGVTKAQYDAAGANNASFNEKISAAMGTTTANPTTLQGTMTAPIVNAPSTQPLATTQQTGSTPITAQQQAPSDLGNFRAALRMAAEEAGKNRMSTLGGVMGGLGINTPGTIGAISDILRSSTGPSVNAVFSDFYEAYKTADEYKKKELDRILDLRLEFGSAIPDNVTTLAEAVKYVTPLIDKERALENEERQAEMKSKLQKAIADQQADGDLKGYATCIANGGSPSECGVPEKLRSQVMLEAAKIEDMDTQNAILDEKQKIKYRLDKKLSNYEKERASVYEETDLTYSEMREIIDYIDGLEWASKNTKNGKLVIPSASNTPLPKDTSSKTQPSSLVKPAQQSTYNPSTASQPFVDLFKGFTAHQQK
jgi:hypothetical protein